MSALRPLVAALALTALGSAMAGEVTFTFNVPVEVSRMPQTVKDVMVWCYLGDAYGTPHGRGGAPLSAAGSYSGTIAVTARVPAESLWGMNDDSWRCKLALHVVDPDYVKADGTHQNVNAVGDAQAANDANCASNGTTCAAEGTPATLRISGHLYGQGGGQ